MEVDTPPTDTPEDKADTSQESEKETPMEVPKDPNDEVRDEDGGIHVDGIYIPPPPLPSLTFDSTKPRLVITHIDNYNFKSYYGKQSLGPFHKSFTSIVGPNGSGKSNVIDSMLFVFGYKASKIRSKKVSVLIHNSDTHPDVTTCTVRVHFQEILDKEGEAFEVIPDTQFSVARTANKDNSSYYEVDGKRRVFKDVAKLLRHKGIDLDHNRFLILQGEVEMIAMMKPIGQNENDTGMLEFLEDIVGSSRFKEPIDILKARTSEMDELRGEKLNRVKLVEKEKDELEKPKNEAMEYLRSENDISHKKNFIYQHYIKTFDEKIEETKQKQAEFQEKCKETLEKLTKITEKKEKRENAMKELSQKFDGTSKELEKARESFKKHEMTDEKLREDMKSLNTKRKKTMKLSQIEKENYEKISKVPEVNKGKIEECQGLLEKHTEKEAEEQKRYDEALANLKTETAEYQEQKEQYETKLISLRKDENEKESQYNVAKSELDILLSTEQKEQCKLESLETKYQTSTSGLGGKKAKIDEHSKAIPDLQERIKGFENDIHKNSQIHDELSKTVRSARANFEETRVNQSQTKSRGKVLDSLMKQKKTGALSGIFGRLGDLGAIDKKYDVAISTAVGGGLDTVLVDTVDTAKKSIEYLKKSGAGRGNFLALDKTLRYEHNVTEPFRSPENAPRLIDLITVDDESFKTAFYQKMQDTLVAEDMQQAKRIAFGAKRFRVVTLGGDLIETSGAMSGGGREKLSGKMGTQIAEKSKKNEVNLEALEAKLQEEEFKLRELNTKRGEAEGAIVMAKRELLNREKDLKKLSMDVKAFDDEESKLQQQIKNQKKIVQDSKPDKARVKDMEKNCEGLQQIFTEASENGRDLKDKVKELTKKIKEITVTRVKAVQSKLEKVQGEVEKVKKEITRLEVECKTSERNLKKSKDKWEAYDSEVSEAETKLREMNKERESLENEGEKIVESVKNFEKEMDEVTTSLKEVKESLTKLEEYETQYKSERIEIDQANEKFAAALKENTKTIQHWRREIAKLRLEDIPGEDAEIFKQYTKEELEGSDVDQYKHELNLLEENLSAKRPDLKAIEEFKRKEAVYLERVAELDDITQIRDRARKRHDDLRKTRLNEFMEGFGIITGKLKEMYQMITLGGDAELELVDSLDPFTEGIVFSVRPPKKSWKNISNLSGGEKTLSSLALVFALHYYKPTPLYVMDEIDAALDFKNVSIVANYIKERTKNAQFIIISLRSNMFELADRLVGIYKTYNCTKTVTINPGKIASAASATASDNLHAAHAAAAGGTGNTQAAGTQEPTQKKRHLATSASASGAALQDQAAAKNAKVAATAAE